VRQSTRHKVNGRTAIAQALRSALASIADAQRSASVAPRELVPLTDARAAINRALEAAKHYNLGGKRRWQRLTKLCDEVNALITEISTLPLTQDEKDVARKERHVSKKASAGSGRNRKAPSRKTVPPEGSPRGRGHAIRSDRGGIINRKRGSRKTASHPAR